jgi:tripartite-type tricarboxylate transporter receptor subunit TctC
MKSLHTTLLSLAAAGVILASPTADAQSSNTVMRLVVPLAAGGPTDQAARLLARSMSKTLGQEIIVENKAGASGAIGAQALASAPADGNTLLFAPSSMTGLPVLLKAAPFASMTDFTAIGAVGGNQLCLFVTPGLPARTTQEFLAHLRANPDKLSYGASSPLEYLVMAQLMNATGTRMTRIPYRGSAQLMPDLLEGRVHAAFIPPGIGGQHAKSGKLRLLACSVERRMPALPDTPTLREAGIQGIDWRAYHLVLAPTKTAPEVAARLTEAVRRAATEPDVRSEFERLMIPVDVLTPQQTVELMRESERIWATFVRETGLTPE